MSKIYIYIFETVIIEIKKRRERDISLFVSRNKGNSTSSLVNRVEGRFFSRDLFNIFRLSPPQLDTNRIAIRNAQKYI